MNRTLIVVLALLLGLFSRTVSAAAADERFLDALRARRLFRTAETYCHDKLADPHLDAVRQATFTIEYMLTLSQHAMYSPPAEREPYWKQARALAERFPANHPRQPVIELQGALVALGQGELARQEAEASNSGDFSAALALLREASQGLDVLEKKLIKLIAERRDNATVSALTADELFALQHQQRYQLARARRNQALCYKTGSNDRLAALQQAVEQLAKLQTQLAADEQLAWRAKIDEGICATLREDFATAARVLTSLLIEGIPSATQAHARAELARVALESGRVNEAQRVIDAGRASAEMHSAELEFAQLEVSVALWKQAEANQDPQNVGRYRQQAVDQLAGIERQFGAYWARRGEWLVIGSASAGDENLEILARTADARFVKQQFDDETLKIYDQAARMALGSKQWQRYLELAYRAAAVQEQRQKMSDAAQRRLALGEVLAERMPNVEALLAKAAAVHLQGARGLAALPSTDEQRAASIDAYERHLALWPPGPTQGDAAWELARLQEEADRSAAAIAAYAQVPAGHAQYGAAALATGRLLLEQTPAQYAAAEERLSSALGALPPRGADRATAQALLVVALAAQPAKQVAAEKLLVELGGDSPTSLLQMLAGLTRISQASRGNIRTGLAALELRAIELLKPRGAQLSAEQRQALERMEAEALAASGQREEALEKYQRLAKKHAGSAAIQQGYAELLATSNDRASLTTALGQWRTIAQRTRPQTERWYRAKYEVAMLNFRLGDKAQAAQLIKYLQATPPGLAGTVLESKFDELLRKCED